MPDHDHHDHSNGNGNGLTALATPTTPLSKNDRLSQLAGPSIRPDGDDPAQQALGDALRVSFTTLKALMIALLVLYLFSGVFRVEQNERAVRLVFGQIVGSGEQAVKQAGWHWNWPFPIGDTVKISVAPQRLTLDRSFMFDIPEGMRGRTLEELAAGNARALNPELDGSLITGDANLVHGVFTTSYLISDPAAFIQTLGNPASDPLDAQRLEAVLRCVLEQSVLKAIASTTADQVVAGVANQSEARRLAQLTLDSLNTGITLQDLRMEVSTFPMRVRDAYGLVPNAEAQRAKLINDAETQRRETLGQAGGAAALPTGTGSDGPLVTLLKQYELSTVAGDPQATTQLRADLDNAFRSLKTTQPNSDATLDVGGAAAGVINQARTDRTALVQTVNQEANTFRKLQQDYRNNPALFKALLWEQAKQQIFQRGNDIETFFSMDGEVRIDLNRDPQIAREREQARLQADRAAREGR